MPHRLAKTSIYKSKYNYYTRDAIYIASFITYNVYTGVLFTVEYYGFLLAYHPLTVAVGASLGVLGGLAGLIVAIVLFCLLLIW